MRGARVPQQWRWRKPPPPLLPLFPPKKKLRLPRLIPSNRFFRLLLLLAFLALVPPVFFHLRLRRLHQMRSRKCEWIADPPLVCAHGGDSTKGVPNTIKALDAGLHWKPGFHNQEVPFVADALALISQSVRQVILDVKVGPPSYEKGLAADILSVVKKTHCRNCLVWAKSDIIGRDVIKLSQDVPVGYIVMKDPSTGTRSSLLRMKGAKVVGVYHHLIDNDLMRVLHRRGKKIYAWTVDDLDSMRRMLFEHVDAIVTSNPFMLQGLMEDLRRECVEEGFSLP